MFDYTTHFNERHEIEFSQMIPEPLVKIGPNFCSKPHPARAWLSYQMS